MVLSLTTGVVFGVFHSTVYFGAFDGSKFWQPAVSMFKKHRILAMLRCIATYSEYTTTPWFFFKLLVWKVPVFWTGLGFFYPSTFETARPKDGWTGLWLTPCFISIYFTNTYFVCKYHSCHLSWWNPVTLGNYLKVKQRTWDNFVNECYLPKMTSYELCLPKMVSSVGTTYLKWFIIGCYLPQMISSDIHH